MHLFTSIEPLFSTKVAAVPLDEDSSRWSSQILQELYRTVPEASEYNPQVLMLRQDDEQGFALGVIVISGQTDSALSAAGNSQPTSKRALIPVVIKNNELCPLDLVMTGNQKMLPLNGIRLREALFRPNTFDMMTDDSGDQSLYSMFYPPGRGSNSPGSGFAGGSGDTAGVIYGPGMKTAESQLKQSMLSSILPTLSQLDLDALSQKVSELGLEGQLRANPAFLAVMSKVSEYDGRLLRDGDPEILMDKAASLAGVDVAQFGWSRHRDTYWMKTAARSLYAMAVDDISRGDLLKLAGAEITEKVDTEGTVTVSDPVRGATPLSMDTQWELVTTPGIYRVKDVSGQEMTGWVLPSLIDFDGTHVPMTAFTNGAAASVQSEVVGSKVSDGSVNLPAAQPTGAGLFYVVAGSGIKATVPFKIQGSEAGMDGSDVLHIVSMTGSPHRLRFVEGLKAMVPGGDEVLMPSTAKFLPLNQEAPVALVDSLDAMKTAAFAQPYIAIRHGGGVIDLEYHQLPGLEAAGMKMASIDDTIFTLCAAGLSPPQAHGLIKQAELTMSTAYATGVCDVRPVADFMAGVEKSAAAKVAETRALRRDLLKEASVLPDIQTVDSVLSLNYINPENIRLYVGKLPYLERALNTVCELTLFSRLGMSEVPENAAARAARAIDEVVQGLKGLAMRTADTLNSAAQAR